ncbi:MAG: gamma-glutamyltransferase [Chloroflexota bacterium]|nr:gamma-glutamyltransferase [Chloroflexota bacterium]MDE2920292.1 gamma-glutamyltransferase [Chloroflexota bacterium]
MICTGHRLSADVGAQVLMDGGNAIDAAAAAVFASWVVEPEMCGVGGTVQGVMHLAASGETTVLYPVRGVPAAATEDMFELEPGLDPWGRWRKVKDDANMHGPRSIATPGALAGMSAVLNSYGSLPLDQLLEPAIAYARDGFPVDGYTALTIGSHLDELRRYPATAAIFAPRSVPPSPGSAHQAGSVIVQADLARSLDRIAHEGAAVFHGGDLGRQVEQYLASVGGILTARDLRDLPVRLDSQERPFTYRGFELVWADGYFAPLMLNILENFDLASLGPESPAYRHLMIETMRYAFSGVLEYLADPGMMPTPIDGLWSKAYAAEIADRIDMRRASSRMEPVDPWPYETRITVQQRPASKRVASRGIDNPGTTQIVAADSDGNLASFNVTHGGAFGSGVTVPGTGIVLNNAMISFDPEPGRANSIRPNRRVMAFAPNVVLRRNGAPRLAFGASGGRTTISCQVHVICGVVDFGMSAQEAIEAPRVHCETGDTWVDFRVGEKVLRELRSLGHKINVVEETFHSPFFGRPVTIEVLPGGRGYRSGTSNLHRTAAVAL